MRCLCSTAPDAHKHIALAAAAAVVSFCLLFYAPYIINNAVLRISLNKFSTYFVVLRFDSTQENCNSWQIQTDFKRKKHTHYFRFRRMRDTVNSENWNE